MQFRFRACLKCDQMARFVQPRQLAEYSHRGPPDSPPTGGAFRNRLVPSPARRFLFIRGTAYALRWFRPPHMAYVNRSGVRRRSRFSAESLYLLVVLAAGVATALWLGGQVAVNLSAVSTVVAVLGINERTGTTRHVGYAGAEANQAVAAYCTPGQAPAFVNGLGTLKQHVGDAMGTPIECEHAATAAGDTVQQTTTGLAAYDAVTNTVTFTDGWHHWAITPTGYAKWDGTLALPPSSSG